MRRRRDQGLTRRGVLAGIGATTAAGILGGCGGDSAGDGGPDQPESACAVTSAMTPAELLAHVEAIVVLCMENRSFDHYLGSLRLVEGRMDVDGLGGAETNPSPTTGGAIGVHQLDDFTPEDPDHSWDACHTQWNGGVNDGFVRSHAGASEADVMGYHVRSQLRTTYGLADAGVICNRWFASCLGPTWPNRFYLHGATSKGQKDNLPVVGFTSVFDRLKDKGVAATNYYSDVAWATGGYGKLSDLAKIERFFEDAAAGNLPPFSIVDPAFFGGGANDDHPDHDVRLGQALIASVAAAVAQSPQWRRSLLVITYDEHGGFFDHVAPPEVTDTHPDFLRLGFRVPALVVGPTVRRGCAIDDVLEHSAVVATATRRFGLEPLNARADAATDLSVCIDPRRIADPLPPPVVPSARVSLGDLARREALLRALPPTHAELAAAVDAGRVPPELDRRAEGPEIARRVLRWGERLGAVEITD